MVSMAYSAKLVPIAVRAATPRSSHRGERSATSRRARSPYGDGGDGRHPTYPASRSAWIRASASARASPGRGRGRRALHLHPVDAPGAGGGLESRDVGAGVGVPSAARSRCVSRTPWTRRFRNASWPATPRSPTSLATMSIVLRTSKTSPGPTANDRLEGEDVRAVQGDGRGQPRRSPAPQRHLVERSGEAPRARGVGARVLHLSRSRLPQGLHQHGAVVEEVGQRGVEDEVARGDEAHSEERRL